MCDDGPTVTTVNECATGGTTLLTDVVTTLSQTPVVITPKDGIASEPTSFVNFLSYICDVYLISFHFILALDLDCSWRRCLLLLFVDCVVGGVVDAASS